MSAHCVSCSWTGPVADLREVENRGPRLAASAPERGLLLLPIGQCPACGEFAYDDEERDAWERLQPLLDISRDGLLAEIDAAAIRNILGEIGLEEGWEAYHRLEGVTLASSGPGQFGNDITAPLDAVLRGAERMAGKLRQIATLAEAGGKVVALETGLRPRPKRPPRA